jgi:hypothetical protein
VVDEFRLFAEQWERAAAVIQEYAGESHERLHSFYIKLYCSWVMMSQGGKGSSAPVDCRPRLGSLVVLLYSHHHRVLCDIESKFPEVLAATFRGPGIVAALTWRFAFTVTVSLLYLILFGLHKTYG